VEEKISKTKFKVVEGKVLEVSDDFKEIRRAYQEYKQQGKDVLFSLPSTPLEFIVENVPIIGIMK
ncbi:MAG: hypothetical protein ACE5I1_24370, partial [bacterium]